MFARVLQIKMNNSSTADTPSSPNTGGPLGTGVERSLLAAPTVNAADTDTYLTEDDLDDVQKAVKYCGSSLPLQRLVFTKRLTSIAQFFGAAKAVEHLLPLLQPLSKDSEGSIRQAVCIQIGQLAAFLAEKPYSGPKKFVEDEVAWPDLWPESSIPTACPVYHPPNSNSTHTSSNSISTSPSHVSPSNSPSHASTSASATASPAVSTNSTSNSTTSATTENSSVKNDSLALPPHYSSISSRLLPVLQTLLVDTVVEVRIAACDALVLTAAILTQDDIGKHVLTCILNLAHDERDEQRITAVQLMNELASTFGRDLCRSFVALEFAAFADDGSFRVRKSAAQCYGNVCAVVGEQYTVSKLLPHYIRLSRDGIWGVRKGCVESMVAVSKCVPPETRKEVFVPMFESFLKDQSRWVRNGACECLGPFIHVLGPDYITKELLATYAGMPSMNTAHVDTDVSYYCAFNFPAVLSTVGPKRWDELSGCFQNLIKASKFSVRRSIACSLHHVGHVLGPVASKQYIVPALDAFLRDVDDVRSGIIQSFALILQCLDVDERTNYVETLWTIQKQKENWRWRYMWAKQLVAFYYLFSSDNTASAMIPFSFALCRDRVALVRETASRALGHLLKRLSANDTEQDKIGLDTCKQAIKSFSTGNTYMDRQLFVRMCEGMFNVIDAELFQNEFLPSLLSLANDPIRNVRRVLLDALSQMLVDHTDYCSEEVQTVVATLRNDTVVVQQ